LSFFDHVKAFFVGGDLGYGPLANTFMGFLRTALLFAALIVGGNVANNYQNHLPVFTMNFLLSQGQLVLYLVVGAIWRFLRSQNSAFASLAGQFRDAEASRIQERGDAVPDDSNQYPQFRRPPEIPPRG